ADAHPGGRVAARALRRAAHRRLGAPLRRGAGPALLAAGARRRAAAAQGARMRQQRVTVVALVLLAGLAGIELRLMRLQVVENDLWQQESLRSTRAFETL